MRHSRSSRSARRDATVRLGAVGKCMMKIYKRHVVFSVSIVLLIKVASQLLKSPLGSETMSVAAEWES